METTPHVFLAGKGAYRFAREQGFPHTQLLTEKSRKAWEKWKENEKAEKPPINQENHIGMLALDAGRESSAPAPQAAGPINCMVGWAIRPSLGPDSLWTMR